MNIAQNKAALIAGATVICLLFLGAVALLVLKLRERGVVAKELKGVQEELQRLYERKPFPSEQNIAQEKDYLVALQAEFTNLVRELRDGQIATVEQSPAKFNGQFFAVQKELLALAAEKGVRVAPDFAFGFQRHLGGELPLHSDVPRLTQQLLIVSNLCHVLYEARITDLRGVVREEFEEGTESGGETPDAGPGPGTGPGVRPRPGLRRDPGEMNWPNKQAGLVPEGAFHGRWRFRLRFIAPESAVRRVLNDLVHHPMLVAVTRVELKGEEGLGPASPAPVALPPESGDTNAVAVPPRDQRIMCGRDTAPLEVMLELEVLVFRPPEGGKPL